MKDVLLKLAARALLEKNRLLTLLVLDKGTWVHWSENMAQLHMIQWNVPIVDRPTDLTIPHL